MKLQNIAFNASQIQPSDGGGSQFTVGKHPVRIIGFDTKATSNGTGGMVVITLKATEGPCAGMTMDDRLNVYNQNPDAVRIALEKLSAYCHVVGRPDFDANNNELEELCDIDFMVEVGPQKSEPKYNEIKKLFTYDGRSPSEVAKSGGAPAGQQPSNSAWGQAQPQQEQQPQQENKPSWGQQAAPAAQQQSAPAWGQQSAPQQSQPATGGVKKPWEK